MSLSDTWTRPSPTSLESTLRVGSTRVLLALPCLFVGAYFLYQYLVLGVVAYVRVGDWAGLANDPGGWVAVMFLSLVFLVPGWFALVYRRQVVVDTARDELVVVQELRPFKRTTAHQLAEFDRVVIVWQPIKDARQKSYDVSLYRPDESSVLVASMTHEEPAAELGHSVARMLGLPLLSVSQSAWRER